MGLPLAHPGFAGLAMPNIFARRKHPTSPQSDTKFLSGVLLTILVVMTAPISCSSEDKAAKSQAQTEAPPTETEEEIREEKNNELEKEKSNAEAIESASPSALCAGQENGFMGPGSISQFAVWLASLPKPLSLDCVLELLPKPLALAATTSTISVQPALGLASPRFFVFIDNLILAIVPSEEAEVLLELSELKDSNQISLKAEFVFPLADNQQLTDPFAGILNNNSNGTVCAGCHGTEQAAPEYGPSAYSSVALKPFQGDIVDRFQLDAISRSCEAGNLTQRCRLIRALFGSDHAFTPQSWPTDMPTIF